MQENGVSGTEDNMVNEMIKRKVPLDKFKCLRDVSRDVSWGVRRLPSSWNIVRLLFVRKPDAEPKKGIKSCRAAALTSVMSNWYATCVFLRLEMEIGENEAISRRWYRCISCQNLQVMMMHPLQKFWVMGINIRWGFWCVYGKFVCWGVWEHGL